MAGWHDEFLRHVSAGMYYKQAAREAGVSDVTLYNHFRQDPDFRARANRARTAPWHSRRMGDTAWHDTYIALIAAGLTREQAADVLGVTIGTVNSHRRRVPAFDARVRSALRGPVHRRRWPVDEDALLGLVWHIASGKDLQTACRDAGTPLPTVKRWRRRWADVDALIVAAATGRATNPIRPYPRLACPGEYCHTKTGYDYGCGEEPCRAAVAEQMSRLRNRKERHQ